MVSEDRAREPQETRELDKVLSDPGYLKLLALSGLVGIPVSLAAFGFLVLEHAAQHWLWDDVPHALGYSAVPWWWPLPLLTVAGLIVAWVVSVFPGHGGHLPVEGVGGGPVLPSAVPGVVVAAFASLSLGAVLGPEAPLMALGSGLALLAVRAGRRAQAPQLTAVLGTAGATAAISAVFGNPLVAVVLIIEAAGIGGPHLIALILPCTLASGLGALVFTGFGRWTGLGTGSLSLPVLPPREALSLGDFLWGIPLAAAIAVGSVVAMTLARKIAEWTAKRPTSRTVACAVAVGVFAAGYGLSTGRSPGEAALSGQATLADLAAAPHAWPVSALILLMVFKGLAWTLSLAVLRGGPVFPALLLGAAAAVLCSPLPGFGLASGLAVGLAAAAAAVLRLPIAAIVLATLLLGPDAVAQMPVLVVASVVSFACAELLRTRRTLRTPAL
ncbi:chloride channel core [Streptomyces lydicus]|uniref:Chloride channel core n=1 Tax=Streptomyces lydicus TaxID=47763 RepID=A0A451EW45_9ACTN|nr:chloride channel core [Streptomyces lydicus]